MSIKDLEFLVNSIYCNIFIYVYKILFMLPTYFYQQLLSQTQFAKIDENQCEQLKKSILAKPKTKTRH